jgi:hypothetical protein
MHFTWTDRTGNNAEIAIPISATPNVDGIALDAGDEIGCFADRRLDEHGNVIHESFCIGGVTWDAVNNVALCAWGNNEMTTAIDGAMDGDVLLFKIWKKSTDTEHVVDTISYRWAAGFSTDGKYHPNAIIGVESFSAPLPIELEFFKAEIHDNQILLTWRTISETSCFGFWIRRQFEGGEWIDRDLIQGHGTTLAPQDYSFIDSPSQPGRYSYQLVQVDLDGSRHDHETLSVEFAPISNSVTSARKSNLLLTMGGIALAIIIVWLLAQFVL